MLFLCDSPTVRWSIFLAVLLLSSNWEQAIATEFDEDSEYFWPATVSSTSTRFDASYSGPYFDTVYPNNISVLAGQTLVLLCRVKNLGDKVVSWVRQSDLAILASAGVSHTSDLRISGSNDEVLGDWQLRIDEVHLKDSGIYECQINTEPKLNFPVMVHVEAAVASIAGASDLYVRTGSTISLTCTVRGSSTTPPRSPFWLHEGKSIALDSPRGGISLETERTNNGMTSKLLLTRAAPEDGGNYTCAPPGSQPASVIVHVLNGEHPAAMQRGNRSPSGAVQAPFSCIVIVVQCLFLPLLLNYR